jgi:hypothetical protein
MTSKAAEFVQMLAKHRFFLLDTVRDLTDEKAARAPQPTGRAWVASSNTSPSLSGSGSTSSSLAPQ